MCVLPPVNNLNTTGRVCVCCIDAIFFWPIKSFNSQKNRTILVRISCFVVYEVSCRKQLNFLLITVRVPYNWHGRSISLLSALNRSLKVWLLFWCKKKWINCRISKSKTCKTKCKTQIKYFLHTFFVRIK